MKKRSKLLQFYISAAVVFIITMSACSSTLAHSRRGRPRGFGRHSAFENQRPQDFQEPTNNNQLEYGGLQQQQSVYDGTDENEGGIQQISIDDGLEDFSSLIHQKNHVDEDETPPRYITQTTETPLSVAPEVVTPKGTFIGLKETVNGTVVYAFYGVPYAKPPTGNLRFARPEPSKPLEEPFHATHLPNTCPQTVADIFNDFPGEKMWAPNTNASEDCLYLNIWVPEAVFIQREEQLVPVFFWIYGGGFFSGSNSLDVYNGAKLAASQGIVVVNVQYRLGPLGFLYLDAGQGNFGLLDQSLGLQWTNQNIEYFGGNPNFLTVAGESCGAASAGFHLVSPLSKNYIKRGMLSSGVPSIKYALKTVTEAKANSLQFAKYAGCNQKNTQEIMECLRNLDSDKLISLQWKLYKNILEFPFSPVIDGYFLPDDPDVLIKKGKAKRADLLVGTVQNEGTYFILYHYLNYFSHLKPTSVPYDRFVDIMNELFYDYSEKEREAIIDQYTNWENPEDGYANQRKIGEALGDSLFVCPQRKLADAWSNRGLSVYFYHFTERVTFNPWADWMGVMHGDDIALVFGAPEKDVPTENENQMINNFMGMVGHFVREGIPSQKWERYTSEHPVYLDVNATKISTASTPNLHGPGANACAFWNRLLPIIKDNLESKCNHNQNAGQNSSPANEHQNPTQWNSNNGQVHPGFQCNNPPSSPQYPTHYQTPCSAPYHSPPMYSPHPHHQMTVPPQYQNNECISTTTEVPTGEPPSVTSTSCKCTVQEASSSENELQSSTTIRSHERATPPPAAIY